MAGTASQRTGGKPGRVRAAEGCRAEPPWGSVLILVGEEEDPQGLSEPQLPTWAGGAASPKPPVPKGRVNALRGQVASLSLPPKT